MKVLQLTRTLEQMDRDDGRDRVKISIDGVVVLNQYEGGEPEDNSFGRDYNFIYDIVKWMKKVAESKEPVEFEIRRFTDEENETY